MRLLSLALLSSTCLAATCSAQGTDWQQAKPSSSPAPRQNHAMIYDPNRNVCVMFGGWSGTTRLNETWEWNGAAWTRLNPLTSPPPRDAIALAYDSARKAVVMTAGYSNNGETWEFDGKNWKQVVTKTKHPLGAHTPMAYDAARKVCVLFGAGQTWEYDGVDWKQRTPTNNPGGGSAMAYDSMRQRVVLLNGNQTWEYDGNNWVRNMTKTVPPQRGAAPGMVYDYHRQVVVLFGGSGKAQGDTWEYDGFDWRKQATNTKPPAPRRYVAMAYDGTRRKTVLFGGRDANNNLLGDTWLYSGSNCYLSVDVPSVMLKTGGVQTLTLDGGKANAARMYWILGTASGTSPGFMFQGAHIPINWDALTFLWVEITNAVPLLSFRGVLDANGQATAKFVLPPNVVNIPIKLHHAFITLTGGYCGSNSVVLELK